MATPKRKLTAARFGKKKAFEKKHFNYGRWTKGRFSEAVTVTGPAKMVFLAGMARSMSRPGKSCIQAISPHNVVTPIES